MNNGENPIGNVVKFSGRKIMDKMIQVGEIKHIGSFWEEEGPEHEITQEFWIRGDFVSGEDFEFALVEYDSPEGSWTIDGWDPAPAAFEMMLMFAMFDAEKGKLKSIWLTGFALMVFMGLNARTYAMRNPEEE